MSKSRRSKIRVWAPLGCALLCLLAAAPVLRAQGPSQYDVEAAYLYNFGKFVRWPAELASTQKTFDICILGHDPLGSALERLIKNDQIDGRPIRERVVAAAAESTGCAIVYIADSEAKNLSKTVTSVRGRGLLLVSDLPHFLDVGGMIQFVLQQDRVRFEVNLDPATDSRLAFSSELLKVAVKVMGTPPGGVLP